MSSQWASVDIVKGLEIGGDDYVSKPIVPEVLVAKVKTHLRRGIPDEEIRFGDLHVHKSKGVVTYRGQEIPLLVKESKLFRFLVEHAKQVFHADQLYELVWNYSDGDSHTVMVHISSLRKKLALYAPDTVQIETIKEG